MNTSESFEELNARVAKVFDRLSSARLEDLSWPEQVVICVWSFSGQVDNGGFAQYFFNSSGDQGYLVSRALEAIGAAKTRSIFQEVVSIYGEEILREPREAREHRVADVEETVDRRVYELETLFYSEPEDLDQLLSLYLDAHPDAFGWNSHPDDAG